MQKKRIKLTIAYDGTNYCGWQVQPNGITVEEVINKALCKLTGEDIAVIGASRTDSGVHALGNVAVFDSATSIPPEDTVRTVTELEVLREGEEITIRISGNGFLYNMVRIIVGTLVRVGRGFYTPEKVKEILEAKDRKAAGVTAPAHGLMLVEIRYPKK